MADTHRSPAEPFSHDVDSYSDDVLVERLYDLAAQLVGGKAHVDRDELARVDAVVYHRLTQAYSKDPLDDASSACLDSRASLSRTTATSAAAGTRLPRAAP